MKTEILEVPKTKAKEEPGPAGCGEGSPAAIRLNHIVVPVEFTEMSLKSVDYAVALARQFDATITLVHVVSPADHILDFSWPVPLEDRRLSEIQQGLEAIRIARIPRQFLVNTAVRQGRTFDAILEVARENQADLIIITTHGRTGLDRALLGSTAENLVRHAACPVLVLREGEEEFVSGGGTGTSNPAEPEPRPSAAVDS